MKKLLKGILVSGLLFSIGTTATTAYAGSVQNMALTRATVHESTTHWNSKGTEGWCTANSFDGTKVYYLKATIKATYSNGKVTGATSSNSTTRNISSADSGKVYENNLKRQFHVDFQKLIDEKLLKPHEYTFECNILNGATENGNLTIQGLKAKTLEEQNKEELAIIQELISQSNEKANKFQTIELEYQNTVQKLEQTRKTLQNDIKTLSMDKNYHANRNRRFKGQNRGSGGQVIISGRGQQN